ncbi:MAG: GNAT family N-acetyltransferase [Anaerolineae bacterium]|nr:GNAT family N-acetyltransferase [Anaerolineae bacterium]
MSSSHESFPVLYTDRLILREPRDSDCERLWRVSRDRSVMRYYGMEPFRSVQEARQEIRWMRDLYSNDCGIRWVIVERRRDADGYIGDVGFHNYAPRHGRAELGYKLDRDFWRRGLMSEALGVVLAHGFESLGLNRIEAVVDPRNATSLGLLHKLGFSKEGLLREYERERSGFADLLMLSLLRREWTRVESPGL